MKQVLPPHVHTLLTEICDKFQTCLGDNFTGFYLHGSLVMGCFNFDLSDIDFLVIIKDPMDRKTTRKIIGILLEASSKAPPKGLEMSIILPSALKPFKYPTPYEFHFSNYHFDRYNNDPDYICGPGEDPDLAAHLVITRERGICLQGESIESIIPEIPREYYLKSILYDSFDSLHDLEGGPDKGICEVPPYAVLNICRVIAYIRENRITSKKEGGEWGLKNLPAEYHFIIEQALNTYLSLPAEFVPAEQLKALGVYAKGVYENV
jgi:predicted nucleotidyltransferase